MPLNICNINIPKAIIVEILRQLCLELAHLKYDLHFGSIVAEPPPPPPPPPTVKF